MRKVAILGGTFDPVHCGHLVMAETALSQENLDMVFWVPVGFPPHKSRQLLVDFEQRCLMVDLAIASQPAFVLSRVEAFRTEPSYAIATFLDLQCAYPNTQWYWIIGLDAFQTLPKWHCSEKIAPACEWLVAPRLMPVLKHGTRQSADENWLNAQTQLLCEQVATQLAEQSIPVSWQVLQSPWLGISSSLIRGYCRNRRSLRYLVPEPVRIYLETHTLYSNQLNY